MDARGDAHAVQRKFKKGPAHAHGIIHAIAGNTVNVFTWDQEIELDPDVADERNRRGPTGTRGAAAWAARGPRPHRGPSAPSCLLTPAPGPCQPRPGRGSWLPVHPRWGELMKTGPLRLAAGTACTDGVLFRCFRS